MPEPHLFARVICPCRLLCALDDTCEIGHGSIHKNIPQGQMNLKCRTDLCHHPSQQQRMPTQLEKIIMHADLPTTEDLGPNICDERLGGGAWSDKLLRQILVRDC